MSSIITKFTLWGLVVAGCTATAAASWYTIKSLDERILSSVESINRSGVMRASWYPKSTMPFSRDGVLHLVVINQHMRQNQNAKKVDSNDPESLRAVQDAMAEPLSEEQQKPVELFVNVSNSVLPLIVTGDATLDMSRGSMANLVKQQAVPASLPITLAWKYTAYNQSVDLRLSMDNWMMEHPDNTVKVGAAELILNGDLKNILEFHYGWQGLKVNSKPAAQGNFEIMPLEGSSLWRRFAGTWISPEGHMTLAGMRFSSPDGKGEMGKFQFDASMEESPSETGVTLNFKHRISLLSLLLNTPQDKFSLEDLSLGLNLTGLNKQGFEELAQLADAEKPDFMQMMKSLNKITTKSVRLELAPSRVKLNKAMLMASGKLETLPFEVEQLMRASAADTPDPFKYMVQGDLTISAETNVVLALPPAWQQQVAAFQQQGFIQSDSKGLISNLLLRAGEVTANGKAVPVDEFKDLRE
jgi:hypothetical protein